MRRRVIDGDVNQSFAADGQTTAVKWPGGKGTFAAEGTFGAGTVKLQWRPDSTWTYIDVASASLTAAGYKNFEISAGDLRIDIAGSTTPAVDTHIGLYSDSD